MSTATGMTKAMFVLDACGLASVREGAPAVWHEIARETAPTLEDAHLLAAAKRLAATRTTERGGAWVVVGDLIAEARKVRNAEAEVAEKRTRQIGEAGTVTHIDVARLMQDARNGVPPEEIGRRGKSGHYRKAGAEGAGA